MKRIKNMAELDLLRQKLKYKELLLEKNLIGSTADLTDHFVVRIKDFAFDFGVHAVQYLFDFRKHKKKSKSEN